MRRVDTARQFFAGLSGQSMHFGGRLDDVEVLANGIEFTADHRLDYYWFEVVERTPRAAGGRRSRSTASSEWRGFRVVKLSELTYLPQEARASEALIRKQAALQRGLDVPPHHIQRHIVRVVRGRIALTPDS